MRERGEHGLGRRVDRAARALVAAPGRPRRMERLGRRAALEDGGHLPDLLRVDPAHDVGHGAAVECRGDEEGRQELGRAWRTRTRRPPSCRRPWPPRTARPRPGRPAPFAARRRAATRCSAGAPVPPVGIDAPHPTPACAPPRACGGGGRSSRWRPAPGRASRGWPAPPGSSSCRSGSGRPRRATGPARPRYPRAGPRPVARPGAAGPAAGRPARTSSGRRSRRLAQRAPRRVAALCGLVQAIRPLRDPGQQGRRRGRAAPRPM